MLIGKLSSRFFVPNHYAPINVNPVGGGGGECGQGVGI